MLVIADEKAPVALAGIMGGQDSEVSAESTAIVLECAWFNPKAITGRGRRYGLFTDSAQRFERGVDFKIKQQAIDLAARLIMEICGGEAAKATVSESAAHLPERSPIVLPARKVDTLLGFRFPRRRIPTILESLGMAVEETEKSEFTVTPPSYRFDIEIAEDLIEELARVHGYDKVPAATWASTRCGWPSTAASTTRCST